MRVQFLFILLAVFVLTGCATMRRTQTAPQTQNVLQTKVANLEEQVAARDQQIADLKSEVENLSDRVNSVDSGDKVSYHRIEYVPLPTGAGQMDYQPMAGGTDDPTSVAAVDGEIIRVPVDAQAVQRALKNAGYYNGKIDGKVGEQTKTAIREFQKYQGLKVDGIIGKATWAALKSYVE